MLMADLRCPYCNALPRGTVELCIATFRSEEPRDEVDWSGDIDTESSHTMFHGNGQPVLVCRNGHDYTHELFTEEVLTNLI